MPNWCSTDVYIHAEPEKLKMLDAKITEWTSKDYYPNSFGHGWLGNVCLGSGIMTKEQMDTRNEGYRCRGSLVYQEVTEDELILQTETAWGPMVKMWKAVCEKLGLKDAEVIYTAEEPGCCVYLTNDPAIENTYVFDIYLFGEDLRFAKYFDYDPEEGKEDAWIQEHDVSRDRYNEVLANIQKDYPDVKSFFDIETKDENSCFGINQFEFAEIDEIE